MYFLLGRDTGIVEILGLNAFLFIPNLMAGVITHSHFRITWPRPLNYILVSPWFHHAHHGKETHLRNKNFGNLFSIWDLLFGTFYDVKSSENITLGIDRPFHHRLKEAYLDPFLTRRKD